ncbi:DNA-3-methyladenine glycosylase 2 family protein [Streptomyces clavuligerus]|uniref:AlkA N-terminal domain-containing protein n=1 Tax=Streptomyces clavuligerus TaxID=1901 RepID=UPI00081033A5|nr:AlkA N-terminal domain-containing protein [Streptomyces clavuligerus]ANW17080.1 AraC family transcriptional regulator [Streptomyces clavuligerus]AXU11617.1 helix-turn-helix domain-containing protein [Streptomyces clavuligerus]MBY6301446.1 DNA-3-methyladenine glycosylase 2 family protein [Streptomyces clavuligerus]QPL61735.1 DNA-3-methyladenine glycosylase 2 family protein [Streptomyces clavuligerus]QPL67768.1 DNA-3-methyladenine glycosylase 2 family protein [Streptomyces clavuligerus]
MTTVEDSRYEAVRSRDARFDGVFFFAVATTGIYCRPSCPALTPKRVNVSFYRTAAAAQSAGYRACRRCRPDAVPGSPEWNTRADVVGRAMRLIGDGIVDREGVSGLAGRLGYSPRQVQRQLNAEVGAGPIALARAQRGHTARVLLQTTDLQAAEIAFAAGFASVRQFNDTMRAIYAATPTELRAARPARPGRTARFGPVPDGYGTAGVPLRLAHRSPCATEDVFDHLALHALAGIEEVTGVRGARVHRRTLRLPGGPAVVEVGERPGGQGWLECRLHLTDLRDLTAATQRVRRLFDLDADPGAVAERLGADPALAPLVAARPGLRVPGSADPEETAVRMLLARRLTPAAARRRGEVLVAALGQPLCRAAGGLTHLFPTAAALAEAPLDGLGLPEERRAALRTLAGALADGSVRLDPGADRAEAARRLLALPGIGARTAARIRTHALGDPDVPLLQDPEVRAGLRRAGADPAAAERWRPWSSYAMRYLRTAP